jgi:hypothetical protein
MGRQTISFTSPATLFTLNDSFKYPGVMARAGLNWSSVLRSPQSTERDISDKFKAPGIARGLFVAPARR